MQVGGFTNIARKVRGLQLSGFINIAESSDYPVGVINIIKDGEQSISISTDETFTTMASFRSGGRVLYSVLGVGYNFNNDHYKYAAAGGIGANIASRKYFRLRSEAIGSHFLSLVFPSKKSANSSFLIFPFAKSIITAYRLFLFASNW